MGETKNFWRGVLIGAIAGGALSLLDKKTRDACFDNCRNTTKNVTYFVKNPSVIADKVKTTSERVRQTVEEVTDDLTFIKEKVEQLAEATPQVMDFVKETKDVFLDNGDTYTETDKN